VNLLVRNPRRGGDNAKGNLKCIASCFESHRLGEQRENRLSHFFDDLGCHTCVMGCHLTPQVQQPGPRGAWMAARVRGPGSRRRMVKRSGHLEHGLSNRASERNSGKSSPNEESRPANVEEHTSRATCRACPHEWPTVGTEPPCLTPTQGNPIARRNLHSGNATLAPRKTRKRQCPQQLSETRSWCEAAYRPNLTHGSHKTRRWQPQRPTAGRCGAWFGRVVVTGSLVCRCNIVGVGSPALHKPRRSAIRVYHEQQINHDCECDSVCDASQHVISRVKWPNNPSSATTAARRVDCNLSALAGLVAAHC